MKRKILIKVLREDGKVEEFVEFISSTHIITEDEVVVKELVFTLLGGPENWELYIWKYLN